MLGILFFILLLASIGGYIYGKVAFKNNAKINDAAAGGRYHSSSDYLPYSPFLSKLKYAIPVFALLFFLFAFMLVKTSGQEVGVVVTPTGVSQTVLPAGTWNFVNPLSKVYYMDRTTQVYTFSNTAKEGAKPESDAIWVPTKDGIKMGFDASISWLIDENYAPWIYSNVSGADGDDGEYNWIEENVVRAKAKSVFALVVSNYTPIEVYGPKRQEIQETIEKRLRTEVKNYHLKVNQVDIREVFYNKEYEGTINQKKLEEQKVLTMEQITRQKEEALKQAEIDKNIAIQQAEGEAKALQIKGSAINQNPKIVQLQWIEAWKSGGAQVPTFISGSGGQQFIMQMPSSNQQ